MKKKIVAILMTCVTVLMLFCSCGGGMSGITVITREKGSGTRSAFIEITGIEAKNEEGTKVDRTMAEAETQSSTAAVITSVSNTKNAVGYISLGSLNDTVKAVKVDGVEATVEKQGKEKKVVVYKYKPKKHYHKKQGHRQPYTKLVINTING